MKVTLKEIAKLDRIAASVDDSRRLPYLGLEHLESNSGLLIEGFRPAAENVLATKFQFSSEHVLYSKLRPYLNKVFLPDFSGVCTTELLPLLPDKDHLDRAFLATILMSPQFVQWATKAVSGANLPRLAPDTLMDYSVDIPSLTEQRCIGERTSRLLRVRKLRRAARSMSGSLIPSIFLELFGDPTKNTKSWEWALLSELGTLDRGRSKNRPRNAPHLYGGPYPFVQTGDIANAGNYLKSFKQTYSESGLAQSKMWSKGTLCITIAANIAKTSILTFDACFPDSVVGFLASSSVRPEYIQCWLSFMQKQLEDTAPESAQKNINLEILRGLKVPVPPLVLQDKFAEVVHVLQKASEQAEEADRQVDLFFESNGFSASVMKKNLAMV